MASLRRKFNISWDDREPIEIATTARDMVNASTYTGKSEDPTTITFGMLYAALVRLNHDVPPFLQWLDLVDELEPIGTVVAEIGDPTQLEASAGVLLRSPV